MVAGATIKDNTLVIGHLVGRHSYRVECAMHALNGASVRTGLICRRVGIGVGSGSDIGTPTLLGETLRLLLLIPFGGLISSSSSFRKTPFLRMTVRLAYGTVVVGSLLLPLRVIVGASGSEGGGTGLRCG